jgi:hybrid cluster-associated redox disulfide protein
VKVTRDTNLGELVKSYPQAGVILLEYGLHCVGCFANTYDTVEMGARVHGMTDEEVDEMIGRVNDAIGEGAAA